MEENAVSQPAPRPRIGREKNRKSLLGWKHTGMRLRLSNSRCSCSTNAICCGATERGYIWGKTDQRIEVPLLDERERQTYFGALDYRTQKFLLKAFDTGNSENTIAFLQYLLAQRPNHRIAVIWDGASYHRSQELKAYLESLPQGLEPSQWKVTCIRFAPHDPDQNPVEDIWLQAKRFVREWSHLCKSFCSVRVLFELVTHRQTFNFPKLFMSGSFS